MDEELQEVFQDGPMVVQVPEEGPGYNQDDDVFNVPEDQQIDINVEEFLAEEKQMHFRTTTLQLRPITSSTIKKFKKHCQKI